MKCGNSPVYNFFKKNFIFIFYFSDERRNSFDNFFFLREFQLMASALNNRSLSSDQDTNQFLV